MFNMLPPTPTPKASYNFKSNQPYHYTPFVSSPLSSSPLRSSPTSSPLSPCDGNAGPRVFSFNFSSHNGDRMMTSPTPSPTKTKPKQLQSRQQSQRPPVSSTIALPSPPPSRGKERESMFSKRPAKHNPLIHGKKDGEDGRETRRKLFLKKVREGAEDKRWKDRGGDEEMMRVLWLGEESERRRMKNEELAMQLADPLVPEEEPNLDEMMAEEVAMNEEAELDAMLGDLQKPAETPYASDDEEYDQIFMDVINEESRVSSQQQQQQQQPEYLQLDRQDEEMMDIS